MKYIEYLIEVMCIFVVSMVLSKLINKPLWDCIMFQSIWAIMFDVISIKNKLEE
jgi:hypothetical protein